MAAQWAHTAVIYLVVLREIWAYASFDRPWVLLQKYSCKFAVHVERDVFPDATYWLLFKLTSASSGKSN